MCGIAGGIWPNNHPSIESRIATALETMRHRGPNDRGYELTRGAKASVAVGQNRLSIIDLSERAHQPMLSEDGRFVLVFNGEIYNYRELRVDLRAEGYIFRSDSDTEVLLAAWILWGKSCLKRLDGMFSFVVHDRREQKLTCVRDAFGIKPLFYAQGEQGFRFASEQGALRELLGNQPKADFQRAYDYLVHADYDSQAHSFVDGVRHLLPGTLLEVDVLQPELASPEVWWQVSTELDDSLSFAEAVDSVREAFLHNIRLHLRSDVPLGAALSGGIDSSAVVCAMRYVEPSLPIHTFSFIAEGDGISEEKWIDLVNEKVGAIPHKVRASAAELAEDITALIAAQGEPFGSTSIYAQYRVFRLAQECGVTVTLDGQGADELLAGYHGFPGQRMLSLWEDRRYGAMHGFAKQWAQWPGRTYSRAWMYLGQAVFHDEIYSRARKVFGRDFQPGWLRTDVLHDAGVSFRETRPALKASNRRRRVIERLAHSLQTRGLPHLLRHGDRNAMAFSIESRVPFLTLPMSELLLSLPENYLISDTGETKRVFRAAMRGIVPDEILDRRDKIGFATPEKEWLKTIAPKVRGWLMEADAVPFLDRDVLLNSFDAIMKGKSPFNWQVWRWVNYVKWYTSSDIF